MSEPEQMRKILAQREEVGRFFYRFPNGESGAGLQVSTFNFKFVLQNRASLN